MAQTAFVFPGQGSQSIGMMSHWSDYQNLVSDVYQQASEQLGYDLWQLVQQGPVETLNQTEKTQPAMLCAGVASWRIWQQSASNISVEVLAGHSLGEYTALVCANSLSLSDAIGLVANRGQLMQSAVAAGEGSMAAIIGLTDEQVIEVCDATVGIVEAVNFNAPGQVVISGKTAAVESAMVLAKEVGAKRALPLPVSVPSHCSLMEDAADKLFNQLESINIAMPDIPVIHNQHAQQAENTDEIRLLLKKQLHQPVRWVATIQLIKSLGITDVVECGPGKILSGLTRRIDKAMTGHAIFDLESLQKTQNNLLENE